METNTSSLPARRVNKTWGGGRTWKWSKNPNPVARRSLVSTSAWGVARAVRAVSTPSVVVRIQPAPSIRAATPRQCFAWFCLINMVYFPELFQSPNCMGLMCSFLPVFRLSKSQNLGLFHTANPEIHLPYEVGGHCWGKRAGTNNDTPNMRPSINIQP